MPGVEIESECPECGEKVGLRLYGPLVTLGQDALESHLESGGDEMYCPNHGGWVPLGEFEMEEV